MSESISLKDVKSNALRLMQEESYDEALKNWNYIRKNLDEEDPWVLYHIGKWNEQIDSSSLSDSANMYK